MRRDEGEQDKTLRLVAAGVFAAMTAMMTAWICHIPYGANGGYIHFGDVMIYLAAVFLNRKYALAAAAVGGGTADLMTAPVWAPATIVIKMLLVLPFTAEGGKILSPRNCAAPLLGAVVTVGGYYLAEWIIFGSPVTPVASIPGNIIQSAGSAVIFYALGAVFDRAGVKERVQQMMHLG